MPPQSAGMRYKLMIIQNAETQTEVIIKAGKQVNTGRYDNQPGVQLQGDKQTQKSRNRIKHDGHTRK